MYEYTLIPIDTIKLLIKVHSYPPFGFLEPVLKYPNITQNVS
jgi:hypothetical protein